MTKQELDMLERRVDFIVSLRHKSKRDDWAKRACFVRFHKQMWIEMDRSGISQRDLALSMGISQPRLSTLMRKPSLSNMLRIAAGLDCMLEVHLTPFSKAIDEKFISEGPHTFPPVPSFHEEFKNFLPSKSEDGEEAKAEFRLIEEENAKRKERSRKATEQVRAWLKRKEEAKRLEMLEREERLKISNEEFASESD